MIQSSNKIMDKYCFEVNVLYLTIGSDIEGT